MWLWHRNIQYLLHRQIMFLGKWWLHSWKSGVINLWTLIQGHRHRAKQGRCWIRSCIIIKGHDTKPLSTCSMFQSSYVSVLFQSWFGFLLSSLSHWFSSGFWWHNYKVGVTSLCGWNVLFISSTQSPSRVSYLLSCRLWMKQWFSLLFTSTSWVAGTKGMLTQYHVLVNDLLEQWPARSGAFGYSFKSLQSD